MKHIFYASALVIFLLLTGTFFFHSYESWSYVDAFYFSTMTLTTIGFGDLVPTQDMTKVFASFYAIFGIGIMLYLLGSIVSTVMIEQEKYLNRIMNRLRLIPLNFKNKGSKKAKSPPSH